MAKLAQADQLIDMIGEWYKKLPNLPTKWREVIVSIIPWLSLIFGVLGVLGGLAAVGIVGALSPFMALGNQVGAATNSLIVSIIFLASSVLWLMAFPGVRAKKFNGWRLLFWSEVLSVVGAVVSFSIGGILGAAIGLYFLYQVKSYYK